MRNEFPVWASLGFLLRFSVVFGLLMLPWPGWSDGYAQYFRAFGQWIFGMTDSRFAMTFAPNNEPGSPLDTQISLENRQALVESGKAVVMREKIDTGSIGWLPTALTVALVGATPIPWRRRSMALVAGLVLIHLFLLFSLQTWIWKTSPDLSPVLVSDVWKRMAYELNYALMNQLGISFTVPVLIWILVTFRRHDELA